MGGTCFEFPSASAGSDNFLFEAFSLLISSRLPKLLAAGCWLLLACSLRFHVSNITSLCQSVSICHLITVDVTGSGHQPLRSGASCDPNPCRVIPTQIASCSTMYLCERNTRLLAYNMSAPSLQHDHCRSAPSCLTCALRTGWPAFSCRHRALVLYCRRPPIFLLMIITIPPVRYLHYMYLPTLYNYQY